MNRIPTNLWVPALRVSAHVTTPPPGARIHFARIFANPEGGWVAEDFEPTTEQPWKSFFMTILLVVIDDIAEVCGAVVIPEFCWPALRKLGRALEIKTFWWRSWDERLKRMLDPVYVNV